MVTMSLAIDTDVPSPMILAMEDILNTETILTLRVFPLETSWRGLKMVRHATHRDLGPPTQKRMILAMETDILSQINLPAQVLAPRMTSKTHVPAMRTDLARGL